MYVEVDAAKMMIGCALAVPHLPVEIMFIQILDIALHSSLSGAHVQYGVLRTVVSVLGSRSRLQLKPLQYRQYS